MTTKTPKILEPRHELDAARIKNARLAIERAGGVNKTGKIMGYSNGSFLTQMFGPKPTRYPTEKTMRAMEKSLGLPHLSLDGAPIPALAPAEESAVNAAQLRDVMRMVNRLAREEGVTLPEDKVAALTAMAYEDADEHRLRQVVQLLK